MKNGIEHRENVADLSQGRLVFVPFGIAHHLGVKAHGCDVHKITVVGTPAVDISLTEAVQLSQNMLWVVLFRDSLIQSAYKIVSAALRNHAKGVVRPNGSAKNLVCRSVSAYGADNGVGIFLRDLCGVARPFGQSDLRKLPEGVADQCLHLLGFFESCLRIKDENVLFHSVFSYVDFDKILTK